MEVFARTYLVLAAELDLAAKGVLTRVVNSASGSGGGVAAMVTHTEAVAEGVVFMLMEVEVVSGTSGLRPEVTSVVL